ncbi:hypothetical protein GGX14DRAFT_637545 [Mycena pura]|uniref:Uncharacterized protein n=1 Tax=Mycena pura TaxID=153505 RepID=A0AAD6VDH3_9AGAR|nr:hypothetical protein GGX14DRAFT_637545 [Mycena pura]
MSHQNPNFERYIHAPPLSIDEVSRYCPGMTFQYSTGVGDDRDIELVDFHESSFPNPPLPQLDTPKRPSLRTPPVPNLRLPSEIDTRTFRDGFASPEKPRVAAPAAQWALGHTTMSALGTPAGHAPHPFQPGANMRVNVPAPPAAAPLRQRFESGPLLPSSEQDISFPPFDLFPQLRDNASGPNSASIKKPVGKRGRGRPKKQQKENSGCEGDDADQAISTRARGRPSNFTANQLVEMARVVIDHNPFLAPHGSKAAAWQSCADQLIKQGVRIKGLKITGPAVHNKTTALIEYKKDPNGGNSNLAAVIGDGTSAAVAMGALLKRLETQYDAAKDKSDDAKAKLKKKADEDKQGGEAIRNASMSTLRKRKRATSPSGSDVDDVGDQIDAAAHTDAAAENDAAAHTKDDVATHAKNDVAAQTDKEDNDVESPPAGSLRGTTSSTASLGSIDSKKLKRRRTMDPRPSTDDVIVTLIKEENARRAEHDDRIAKSFETLVEDSRQQKSEMTSILRDLLKADN